MLQCEQSVLQLCRLSLHAVQLPVVERKVVDARRQMLLRDEQQQVAMQEIG